MTTDTKQRAQKIIERSRVLSPVYERAVREEGMTELLMVRHEMMAAVQQADRVIADAIVENVERRIADR